MLQEISKMRVLLPEETMNKFCSLTSSFPKITTISLNADKVFFVLILDPDPEKYATLALEYRTKVYPQEERKEQTLHPIKKVSITRLEADIFTDKTVKNDRIDSTDYSIWKPLSSRFSWITFQRSEPQEYRVVLMEHASSPETLLLFRDKPALCEEFYVAAQEVYEKIPSDQKGFSDKKFLETRIPLDSDQTVEKLSESFEFLLLPQGVRKSFAYHLVTREDNTNELFCFFPQENEELIKKSFSEKGIPIQKSNFFPM